MNRRSFLLGLLLLGFPVLACSVLHPASTRKKMLQDDLQQFHVGLLAQTRPELVRPLPLSDREPWGKAWDCYFHRFRVIDYVIDAVRFHDDAIKADVSVQVTGHALNALATRQQAWREKWVYDRNKWRLEVRTEAFREILGECYPEVSSEKSGEP